MPNPLRFDIRRKITTQGPKPFWAPVGSLTLWNNPDKVSGRLRLFMLEGEELYVFEAKERGAQSEAPPAEQNTDVAKGDIPF